jgi:hypothetical protein
MSHPVLGQPQDHAVVREGRSDDLGDTREHVADVEHVRQKTEKVLGHASHGIVVAEYRRDEIGERLGFLKGVVAVGPPPARQHGQDASCPVRDADR